MIRVLTLIQEITQLNTIKMTSSLFSFILFITQTQTHTENIFMNSKNSLKKIDCLKRVIYLIDKIFVKHFYTV